MIVFHVAAGVSSSAIRRQASFHSKDSHGTINLTSSFNFTFVFVVASNRFLWRGVFNCTVKFSIKSFKVPELFIEVPENATVGSLKVQTFFHSVISGNSYFVCMHHLG